MVSIDCKFDINDKVKPLNKTAGSRDFTNSATFYMMFELNQDFLYVVRVNVGESERVGEPCYWCGVHPKAPMDTYRESDLVKYEV